MSWIKATEPARAPAPPIRVDVDALHRHAKAAERFGPLPPPLATLVASAPAVTLDRWGVPLPLTMPQQARLDRIGAVLSDPWRRPRQLLRAGQLAPDEIAAMAQGRPEQLARLRSEVEMEMITAGPPLSPWMESQLAILFDKPSDRILAGAASEDEEPAHGPAHSMHGGFGPNGTPADRRELAVRER